jgi:hypothetical protein
VAKIPKKVQVIADNLQKVEKAKAPPAAVEVHAVEPVLKVVPSVQWVKAKGKKSHKKKREGVAYVKEGPVRKPEEEEERSSGYAGLARRIAGRLVGEIRGKPKFWFDD